MSDERGAAPADLWYRHVCGETLRDIAHDLGITRERVRQIVTAYAADLDALSDSSDDDPT